jgi:uncharacterized protein (DUF2236 family)
MKPPLFAPGSVFWRVNRELVSGLAGPRAVLMQIAHPLVAAGVADHSHFREHRFARLYRTAMAAAAITFCSEDLARKAIQAIDRRHKNVHGFLREQAGAFPPGTPYDANNPDLKLWVLSTITDSTILVYDCFVKPLSLLEREEYYRDSLTATRLFNIPDQLVPSTYAGFQAYMHEMLNGKIITVSSTAREIARALFSPSPAGTVLYLGSAVGIGLLPERLQQEFGLRWSQRRERWLKTTASVYSRARRLTPTVLCSNPAATVSEWAARL